MALTVVSQARLSLGHLKTSLPAEEMASSHFYLRKQTQRGLPTATELGSSKTGFKLRSPQNLGTSQHPFVPYLPCSFIVIVSSAIYADVPSMLISTYLSLLSSFLFKQINFKRKRHHHRKWKKVTSIVSLAKIKKVTIKKKMLLNFSNNCFLKISNIQRSPKCFRAHPWWSSGEDSVLLL